MGAVIASDRVAEPFMTGTNSFTHGFTFAGHPVCSAIAMANLDVFEREGILENVRANEGKFRAMLDGLRDLPIVGDVRGTGYFHAIELVKDKETKETFNEEECETLLRGFLSARALPPRADLPRRRSRRPGDPAVAAADRGARAVRGDRGDPARRADRGRRADARPRPGRRVRGAPLRLARSERLLAEMLTVGDLLRDLDVRLLAGERGLHLPVRWVHISELLDPTPWLSGGELLLTTGMQLDTPAQAREFAARLADHHLAGLGFGTGFKHATVPETLLEVAAEREFPVFEVPYEVPFIAVTEAAFTQLVNEQYAVLRRALAAQERLERIVLSERGSTRWSARWRR